MTTKQPTIISETTVNTAARLRTKPISTRRRVNSAYVNPIGARNTPVFPTIWNATLLPKVVAYSSPTAATTCDMKSNPTDQPAQATNRCSTPRAAPYASATQTSEAAYAASWGMVHCGCVNKPTGSSARNVKPIETATPTPAAAAAKT